MAKPVEIRKPKDLKKLNKSELIDIVATLEIEVSYLEGRVKDQDADIDKCYKQINVLRSDNRVYEEANTKMANKYHSMQEKLGKAYHIIDHIKSTLRFMDN